MTYKKLLYKEELNHFISYRNLKLWAKKSFVTNFLLDEITFGKLKIPSPQIVPNLPWTYKNNLYNRIKKHIKPYL